MARARIMPPAWAKDEDLAACDPLARLLHHYLYGVADRLGRLEDRPRRIQVECLPYDTGANVDALLDQLEARGYIVRYTVAGKKFISISAFDRWQRPHVREAESEIPEPPARTEHNLGSAQHEPGTNLGESDASPRSPVSVSVTGDGDGIGVVPVPVPVPVPVSVRVSVSEREEILLKIARETEQQFGTLNDDDFDSHFRAIARKRITFDPSKREIQNAHRRALSKPRKATA